MTESRAGTGRVFVESASDPIHSDDEAEALELLARWMDSAFTIPGMNLRFGLDALIGLLPGIGDAVTFLVSIHILNTASRLGVPRVAIVRMALNIALDLLVGAIPFVGDAFDVFWKSNSRNVELLRRYQAADSSQRDKLRGHDRLFVGGLLLALVAVLGGALVATYALVAWLGRALFS